MTTAWPNASLKISRFLSDLKETRTWGCESMIEGPTIMLRVFITLLCIHTMPNNHYCSTYMMAYHHLMAKLALELAENRDFFLI